MNREVVYPRYDAITWGLDTDTTHCTHPNKLTVASVDSGALVPALLNKEQSRLVVPLFNSFWFLFMQLIIECRFDWKTFPHSYKSHG